MFTTQHKPDDVGLAIAKTEFRYWDELEIKEGIDRIGAFSFTAPFEPERKEFRETFRPFSYKRVTLTLGGATMITGTMVGVHPQSEADSGSVEVNGYALAGTVEDCTLPGSTKAREFKKLGLGAIAAALLQPFGLKCQVRGDEGAKFEKVRIDEEQKVLDFLADLARQRNMVLTSLPNGDLLAWRSVPTGNPVARLRDDREPVTKITSSFSPQEYYSEVTGFAAAKRGRKGSKYTHRNPWLTDVLRPMCFKLDDTERADAPEATRAKVGRMFANMACWSIEDLPTWRDPNGNVWTPNTTILLRAPKVMIYRETELLIRSVTLRQNAEKKTAALEVVLPGAFTGEIPATLPWDE